MAQVLRERKQKQEQWQDQQQQQWLRQQRQQQISAVQALACMQWSEVEPSRSHNQGGSGGSSGLCDESARLPYPARLPEDGSCAGTGGGDSAWLPFSSPEIERLHQVVFEQVIVDASCGGGSGAGTDPMTSGATSSGSERDGSSSSMFMPRMVQKFQETLDALFVPVSRWVAIGACGLSLACHVVHQQPPAAALLTRSPLLPTLTLSHRVLPMMVRMVPRAAVLERNGSFFRMVTENWQLVRRRLCFSKASHLTNLCSKQRLRRRPRRGDCCIVLYCCSSAAAKPSSLNCTVLCPLPLLAAASSAAVAGIPCCTASDRAHDGTVAAAAGISCLACARIGWMCIGSACVL